MDDLNILSLIIGCIFTLFFQYIIVQFFKKIMLSLKNKYFSREQILGEYYGYYLHKDAPKTDHILRESIWEISADFKKGHYNVVLYRCMNNKKSISYTGKMWTQNNHYLLQFDSKEYNETVFERKLIVTKANDHPIIGIGIAAVTQGYKIRANISILSKKRLSLSDFRKIVEEYKVKYERETYNLKIER